MNFLHRCKHFIMGKQLNVSCCFKKNKQLKGEGKGVGVGLDRVGLLLVVY